MNAALKHYPNLEVPGCYVAHVNRTIQRFVPGAIVSPTGVRMMRDWVRLEDSQLLWDGFITDVIRCHQYRIPRWDEDLHAVAELVEEFDAIELYLRCKTTPADVTFDYGALPMMAQHLCLESSGTSSTYVLNKTAITYLDNYFGDRVAVETRSLTFQAANNSRVTYTL